jgi:hypothetical protein
MKISLLCLALEKPHVKPGSRAMQPAENARSVCGGKILAWDGQLVSDKKIQNFRIS